MAWLALAGNTKRDPRWLWGDLASLTYWLSATDRSGRRLGTVWLYLDAT